METTIYFLVLAMVVLAFFGWDRGVKWARWMAIILFVLMLCSAGAISLYIYALGQSDWSH